MEISNQSNQPSRSVAPSLVFIVIFGLLITAGGFFVAQAFTQIILPEQGSIQAQNTDNLFYILMLIGGIVFFLVQGLLLYSVIRFRQRANDLSDGPPIHGNTTLEIVWTVIPAIVVVVLSVLSFIVWDTNNSPQPNENFVNGQTLQLGAVGARYAWSFNYGTEIEIPAEEGATDAEARLVSFSSNELHTYVGQNVKLDMNTRDVIHSFWVPAMRVKQDLLPGRTTEIRFTPVVVEGETYPARYRLICTELCGGGHGQMYSWLVVHESEEAYLAEFFNPAVDAVLNPPDDPVLRGEQLIAAYPCAGCHVLDALGWAGLTGPSLNGLGDRAGNRAVAAGALNGADYIAQSIRLPLAYMVPGAWSGNMPAFVTDTTDLNYMPDEDLSAIVAYLCAQTASGDPADNTCGLEYADGALADTEAAIQFLDDTVSTYSN